MIKSSILADLAAQISKVLPDHLGSLKSDFEKNCQTVLTKTFAKLDLVTREEFDAQTKVLLRTRKKLEELEMQLSTMEASLKTNHRE